MTDREEILERFWDRFWDRVAVEDTGCWTWQAGRTAAGYGQIHHHGKRVYTHRVAYEERYGEIPAGMEIDHLCRNRACLNPEHLEAVSHSENIRRGLNARLAPEDVTHIRDCGTASKELAERFGVTVRTINQIRSGESWKDLLAA